MKNSTQSQRRKKNGRKSSKKSKTSKTKAGKSTKKKNGHSKGKSKKKDTKTSSKFLPEYSDTIVTFFIHMTRRHGFLCPRVADMFRMCLDWTKDPRVGRKSCEEDDDLIHMNYHVTVSVQRLKLRHLYDQRHQLHDSKARNEQMRRFLFEIERLGPTPKRMINTLLKKHFDMDQNSLARDLAESKLIEFKMEDKLYKKSMCIDFQKNEHVVRIVIDESWIPDL